MKNFTHLMVIVLFSITLHSCTKEKTQATINIDSTTLDLDFLSAIPAEGGTTEFKFESSLDWEINTIDVLTQIWLNVTPTSGGPGTATVTITASENKSLGDRQSTISIISDLFVEDIIITQKQKNALTLTSSNFEVPQEGKNIKVVVKANIDFKVTIADDSKDWITQEQTKALKTHNLEFIIAASKDLETREGSIIISKGDISEEIKISQLGGRILVLDKNAHSFTKVGGSIIAKVSSNFNFEIKMPDVDWITEITTKSTSNHTKHFEVSEKTSYDSRTAKILFRSSDGEVSESIIVYQSGNSRGYYESTDYSKDGEVITLQTASSGDGIDLVIVGDAFSDKDMGTDGKYEQRMREAMNHFFSEEPYKTYRDRYNVYTVKAVSKNEIYDIGSETIFECKFKGGTTITGNHNKVIEYALKAIPDKNTDDLTMITILNSPTYAGTCYMYINNASISYCPIVYYEDEAYRQIVCHEAGGHGFSKLADEYFYAGTISAEAISQYKQYKRIEWLANLDFTNDPATISWAHFLSDSRYENEVGIFEGAVGYVNGVYRPTEYSIMRSNIGGFNAPSREAIFKRIITLSGGYYNFEDFAAYDAKNRTTNAMAARRAQAAKFDESTFVPLAPPVFMGSRPEVGE